MSDAKQIAVVHVEVGGSYGGSFRALELYLAHSQHSRFLHDVLFYYPTPGSDRLTSLARDVRSLYQRSPNHPQQRGATPGKSLRAALKASPFAAVALDCYEWISLARTLPTVRSLSKIFRDKRYDVIHVNNTFTYQPATLLAARLARIPVVAHVRNPVRPGSFSKKLMGLAAQIITVNRAFETELRSNGISVRTCYDALKPPTVDRSASSQLRASLVPPGGILIGSVGRLDKQKGYEDFVRAARRVVDVRSDVQFAIAGDGPSRAPIEKLIAALDLTARFRLCGFRDDPGNFVEALDLFVSSSLWEGLPLSVMEAMLLRKAVVATDVGGNSEIIVPGVTGELVPPSNPEALASAILAALDKKDHYHLEEAKKRVALLSDPTLSAQAIDETIEIASRAAQSRA
jgi:glycosyltransferase involved in cell wall biosynthesis